MADGLRQLFRRLPHGLGLLARYVGRGVDLLVFNAVFRETVGWQL